MLLIANGKSKKVKKEKDLWKETALVVRNSKILNSIKSFLLLSVMIQ